MYNIIIHTLCTTRGLITFHNIKLKSNCDKKKKLFIDVYFLCFFYFNYNLKCNNNNDNNNKIQFMYNRYNLEIIVKV